MKKRKWLVLLTIFLTTILINVIAWNSIWFCDLYVEHVFPIWLNVFGRINGIWSFSIGEIMVAVGLALIALAIVLGVTAAVFFLLVRNAAMKNKMKKLCTRFYQGILWAGVLVFAIMTLNCFVLYHCSTFDEKYMTVKQEEYTLEQLCLLRDYTVNKVNELAKTVERDQDGNVVYDGDMHQAAIMSMQNLGQEYEQLQGYYPRPKQISTSKFLSQQHMKGYYFPFSMEANYNSEMYVMNMPATICHELAHTKGFIYEDEANLIGFLACVQSEDPFFQYSGYLSVLNYIDNDFYESYHQNRKIYNSHVKISAQVKQDNVFLTEEAWRKVEEKAIIETAAVKKMSEEFIETNLVVNGIEDGSLSYGRVVGLLLDYYDNNVDSYLKQEYWVQGEESGEMPKAK